MEIRQRVREIRVQNGWTLIKVNNVPDKPGVAAKIFGMVAAASIPIGLILQNASVERITDVSFTVKAEDALDSLRALDESRMAIGAATVQTVEDLSVVEIVGTGILTDPSYVGHVFRTLAEAGVNILSIGTSEIRITILLEAGAAEAARNALHHAFRVGESPAA